MLVIDDDLKLCRLIRDYLEPIGYEVSAARSGTDGVVRNGESGGREVSLYLPEPRAEPA